MRALCKRARAVPSPGASSTSPRARYNRPSLDFLLECVGFPPNYPLEQVVRLVRERGEAAVWRGDPAHHLRLALGAGLELRADFDPATDRWNVLPYYRVEHRLRVSVDEVRALPESPFDALLIGWAAPPTPEAPASERNGRRDRGAYRLSAYVTDARRLPPRMPRGHVLAVNVAGFALDVDFVGPDEGVYDLSLLERDVAGASIVPLGSPEDPGGCAEVSLRIRKVLHLVNPFTEVPVEVLEVDAPERPLHLFVSRWQLEHDQLPAPRPGGRIEGTFLFIGRIAGGLPGPAARRRPAFG